MVLRVSTFSTSSSGTSQVCEDTHRMLGLHAFGTLITVITTLTHYVVDIHVSYSMLLGLSSIMMAVVSIVVVRMASAAYSYITSSCS